MIDTELERLLVQVRRIEEHREKGAEAEIRKTYQKLLQELRHYMADEYSRYAEDDRLTYEILQRNGYYARFLEEVEQKINDISPEVRRTIRSTVEQTYEHTYNGMIDCVQKAAARADLGVLKGCTPEVIKRAVENPISKLTLNDRLEKHRKEIIYGIKQDISIGLMNGDRYSTMANRIKKSVEGDYKKAIRIARTETHRVREAGNHDAAVSVNEALKNSTAGVQMMKTWKTMKDERVRPAKAKGRNRKYDHQKMEGVTVLVNEEFTLPSGAKTMAPGQSGVAGEDINCRCYLSYGLQKFDEINKMAHTADEIDPESGELIEPQIRQRFEMAMSDLGVNCVGFETYRGDSQVLDDLIQGLKKMKQDIPLIARIKNGITLKYEDLGNLEDFAVSKGKTIRLNKRIFDSTNYLKKEYEKCEALGLFSKGTDYKSIIYHEMGHVLNKRNPAFISKLSNIIEEYSKADGSKTLDFIQRKVSLYAGSIDWKGNYEELLPELLSIWYNNGTQKEFAYEILDKMEVFK